MNIHVNGKGCEDSSQTPQEPGQKRRPPEGVAICIREVSCVTLSWKSIPGEE